MNSVANYSLRASAFHGGMGVPMSLDSLRSEKAGPDSNDHAPHVVDYTRDVRAGFAKRYLATYFQEIDADERAITEFLVGEYRKINGASAMLDLGCGPGVQHVLSAVPYVDQIDMADFLPDNIEELSQWQQGNDGSHNWNHVTKLVLELEGNVANSAAITAREKALRAKLRSIRSANVLQEFPLGEPVQYPAVGFFYCAEAAARTKVQWQAIMKNVAGVVERGGYLFMASLRNATYYTVGHADGSDEKIPTASVNEADFAKLLPALGFDRKQTLIERTPTPDMADHGIEDVLLISARKL
jgi:hypothetical protein